MSHAERIEARAPRECANLKWAMSEHAMIRKEVDKLPMSAYGTHMANDEHSVFARLLRRSAGDHWREVVIPKVREIYEALDGDDRYVYMLIDAYRGVYEGHGRGGSRSLVGRIVISDLLSDADIAQQELEWAYESIQALVESSTWSRQAMVDMMIDLHGGWSEPHAAMLDWLQETAVDAWYNDQGIPQTVRDAASVRVIIGVLGDWRIVGRDLVNDIQTATIRLTHCNDDTGDLDEPCVVESCYRTYGHAHLDCRACDVSTTLAYHVARFKGAYQAWNKRHTHV